MDVLTFNSISDANEAGYITVKQAKMNAKIIDVTRGNQFGYRFQAVSYRNHDNVLAQSIYVHINGLGGCAMFRSSELK